MSERYDPVAASHYAAYRPPLHERILGRLLRQGETFAEGLDLGCGTGASSLALAEHCGRVVGLDSSPAMLGLAHRHPRVEYVQATVDAGRSPWDHAFDVVSLAGALVYLKGDGLRAFLRRVGKPGATVLVYDFELVLDQVLARLRIPPAPATGAYDHALNLADWAEFEPVTRLREDWECPLAPDEVAHVLLSDSHRHDAVSGQWRCADPFGPLVEELRSWGDGGLGVPARVFGVRYRIGQG